jgi:hypothetical protein
MHGGGGIDKVTAQRPQARLRPLLVGSSKSAVSGDIGRQNCREFADLNSTATMSLPIWRPFSAAHDRPFLSR